RLNKLKTDPTLPRYGTDLSAAILTETACVSPAAALLARSFREGLDPRGTFAPPTALLQARRARSQSRGSNDQYYLRIFGAVGIEAKSIFVRSHYGKVQSLQARKMSEWLKSVP
ncbi:MAG TPA: hypothetical protein VI306_04465, partial [Pyrinomonadaceae bacterium]